MVYPVSFKNVSNVFVVGKELIRLAENEHHGNRTVLPYSIIYQVRVNISQVVTYLTFLDVENLIVVVAEDPNLLR